MNRRDFLTGIGSRPRGAGARAGAVPRSMSAAAAGLQPYTGPWGFEQAAHLLRRTTFGVRKQDVDAVAAMGLNAALDTLLGPSPTPPTPQAYVSNQAREWVTGAFESSNDGSYQTYLVSWLLDLMLRQGISISEKMTLFWHNHFATGYNTVKDARYMYRQNALLRSNVLGNFKDLTREITLDPAMLRYLNGSTNRKGSPNENYARELQELFTIGKGPEIAPGNYTNYTEEDVQVAARVLTGWSDDTATIGAKFTANAHDTGDKTFSAAYGGRTIRGGAGETEARRELDEMLTMIFDQEATSKYIVRKIYRWFVDYVIDPTVESEVIEPLAQQLHDGGYEIAPVMRTLLASAHFHDSAHHGCMIKTPADLVIGTIRFFPSLDDSTHPTLRPTDLRKKNWMGRTLRRLLASLQMEPMNPPNVAGWPAYWQEPVFHEIWINADTLQKRVKLGNDLTRDGFLLDEEYNKSLIDAITATDITSDPSDPRVLVDEFARLLFPLPLSAAQKDLLNEILTPGLPDYEWTVEWEDHKNNPDDATKRKAVEDKLRALLQYMLAMAEYQLS